MSDQRDVTAWELRRHLAEHLDRVRAGERFVITRNGRVAGQLVPPDVETRSTYAQEDES